MTGKTERAGSPGNEAHCQLCTFYVAGRLFGVDILDVKEINAETEYTPVFHAPREVSGYVNIRGQIHLVLDLCALLGLQGLEHASAQQRRLVLFKQSVGDSFAVQVDTIGDIVNVSAEQFEPAQGGPEGNATEGAKRLMKGVCRLEKGIMVVLDARKFLTALS